MGKCRNALVLAAGMRGKVGVWGHLKKHFPWKVTRSKLRVSLMHASD
jgi:hypothetical protein